VQRTIDIKAVYTTACLVIAVIAHINFVSKNKWPWKTRKT
jgi:hypothetical protein